MDEKIIGALIGLAGAVNNGAKTENADALVIKALAFSPSSERSAKEITDEIHAEKNRISPGCATCVSPCGNTSDYDMSLILGAEDEIGLLKKQVISELQKAARLIGGKRQASENEMIVFYRALLYLKYDLDKEDFLKLLEEIERIREDEK